MLDNKSNQPSKFKTKNWVWDKCEAHEVYRTYSQIKFKIYMLTTGFCNYSDVYILVIGTIAVPNTGIAAAPNNRNKKVIFKNCAPFTDCTSEINNKEINHDKNIAVVIPM